MFKYEEYAVTGTMSGFIKKLWRLDNSTNIFPVKNKSVLPNGCFNLAFITGNGLNVQLKYEAIRLPAGVFFVVK